MHQSVSNGQFVVQPIIQDFFSGLGVDVIPVQDLRKHILEHYETSKMEPL